MAGARSALAVGGVAMEHEVVPDRASPDAQQQRLRLQQDFIRGLGAAVRPHCLLPLAVVPQRLRLDEQDIVAAVQVVGTRRRHSPPATKNAILLHGAIDVLRIEQESGARA